MVLINIACNGRGNQMVNPEAGCGTGAHVGGAEVHEGQPERLEMAIFNG